jgi:hypothetical protein
MMKLKTNKTLIKKQMKKNIETKRIRTKLDKIIYKKL